MKLLFVICLLLASALAQTGNTTTTTKCTLATGVSYDEGWKGPGLGTNYCNDCMCHDGQYYCSMKVCPPKLPTPISPAALNPISPLLPRIPQSVPSSSIPKLPGTGPTNRNTCGGKNKKLCEGMPVMLCRQNPCCFISPDNMLCTSVSEVKYNMNGQECK